MANLPTIKRITREDLQDAPQWIERLLSPLNQFMDAVGGALNKTLTLEENAFCQIQTMGIVAGAAAANNTAQFLLTMKRKPQYMIPLSASVDGSSDKTSGSHVKITWNCDGANVNITSISDLTNGTSYVLTVLIF